MRGVSVALALFAAAAVGLWWGLTRRAPGEPAPGPAASRPAIPPVVPERPRPSHVAAAPPREEPSPPRDAADESPAGDEIAGLEDAGRSWDAIDMNAVRAALPNNLYWTMSAPTKDPAVLRAREEERDRWNTEYGKVLSSTATAGEIDAYYARRRRVSLDYVEFATHLLSHYSEQLPHRDVRLLQLAIQMHLARLEEIPRQITEAQERREAHDAARRAWQEQQQAFGGEPDAPE
jgi:hypothetical protein